MDHRRRPQLAIDSASDVMIAMENRALSRPADSAASHSPSRDDRHVFALLLSLYFLILYPILRANRYFNDDLKRALIGHTGWDSNGRPLTTLLMKLMQCYDSALVDISPLTQIASVAVLTWTGVLIARRYVVRSPLMAALVAFPLGAQPFYLENLSYKFDALSMSLAMLLALLPVLAIGGHRRGWWLGALALFGSLSLYQPAINAYLIFVLLDVLLAQLRDEPVASWLKTLASRMLQVGMTMLVYQLVLGIHIHGSVGKASLKIHKLSELPLLVKNVGDFYHFIGNSFGTQWWAYFLPLLLVLAVFPLTIGIRYTWVSRVNESRSVQAALWLGSVLLPAAALLCIAGPMLLLLNPERVPRVLMGIGALLVSALILMHAALGRWQLSPRWVLGAGCMLAIGMCSFASAYGNALGEQKAYEDRIAASLADDLASLRATAGIQHFLLDGSIGYAPITAHIIENFPMIRSLILPYLDAEDRFRTNNYLMYYVDELDNLNQQTDPASLQARSNILARARRMPAVRYTSSYSVQVIDRVAVVTLNSTPAQVAAVTEFADAGMAAYRTVDTQKPAKQPVITSPMLSDRH